MFSQTTKRTASPRMRGIGLIAGLALAVGALTGCGGDPAAEPIASTSAASTSAESPASTLAADSTSSAAPSSSDESSTAPAPDSSSASAEETSKSPDKSTPAKTTEKSEPEKTTAEETTSLPPVAPGFKLEGAILAPSGPILPESKPVSISIPAIDVTSSLMDLGLNPDGTVEVPSIDDPNSEAGWYTGSPTPGEQGPSIILGHIDSRKYGPGVFYNLDKLTAGDMVEVTRDDGSVATFKIDKVESYLKAEFPTDEIYGNISNAGIRLITCGGAFNSDEGSYESNIIAFGSLVS